MPELDDRQLDLAIRDLVGRAAADAPTPPSIDDLSGRPIRLEPEDDRDRSRWIVTGIAGMSIAAAVVGLLVLSGPDDIAEAPATEPPTAPPPAPTTPSAEAEARAEAAARARAEARAEAAAECTLERMVLTAAIRAYRSQEERYPASQADLVAAGIISSEYPSYELTADGRDVVRVPGVPCPAPSTPVTGPPVVVTGPESTPAPTTIPPTVPTVPAATPEEVIMIAGVDGIIVDDGEQAVALDGTGADIARRVPDGRIYFQHRGLDPGGVYVIDGGEVSELAMPPDLTATAVLHDVAVVDGEVVLLAESSPGDCNDPNTCLGSIWAIRPDTGAATMIEESNVWESGWSALSLSDTGVIVGTWYAEASYGMYSGVLPGVDAQPIEADALGVEPDYVDCSTCPKAFTIDRTGRFVGYLVTADDGTIGLIAKDVTGSGTTVGYVVGDATSIPTFPTLDISGVDAPGGNPTGRAIVGDSNPDAVDGAQVFDLANPSYEPIVIGMAGERMGFSA